MTDPVSGLSVEVTVLNGADDSKNKTRLRMVSTGSGAPYRHEESDELDSGVSRHYEIGLRC